MLQVWLRVPSRDFALRLQSGGASAGEDSTRAGGTVGRGGSSSSGAGGGAAPGGSPGVAGAEEEEPRLKYQRLGCDLTDVLAAGAATCLAVSDKILALATTAGTVHLLDYEGNQARPRRPDSLVHSVNVSSVDALGGLPCQTIAFWSIL